MKSVLPAIVFSAIAFGATLAQEKEGDGAVSDRKERGIPADSFEKVRGDSGRWRDEAQLLAVPSPTPGEAVKSIDELADRIEASGEKPVAGEGTWLVYRTRQLDDNDRLWIDSIEQDGSEIRVVMSEAIWQGYYSKTFTWYGVYAIDLGPLPAGEYRVQWTTRPLVFTKFDEPRKRDAGWPADEKSGGESSTTEYSFVVAE